jgi:hypothetical protein
MKITPAAEGLLKENHGSSLSSNSGIVRGNREITLFTGIPDLGPPRIANSIPLRD